MSAAIERQTELEGLRGRKQQLAYAAINGDKKAKAELTTVVRQLADAEQELELIELAEKEKRRRDAEAEQERQAAERLAKEDRLKDLRADAQAKWLEFQAAVDAILEPLGEAYEAERAVYGTASDLGLNPRWNIADRLTNYISSTVGPRLAWRGFDYISPRYRVGAVVEQVEFVRCETCGGEYPSTAIHTCSEVRCAKCKKLVAKNATRHGCIGESLSSLLMGERNG